ncbi:DUF6003 family protein [Streptomyces sp. NPDC058084]|uniref:DUF6003 family protein n=1 Tax=Streptomyces sp. NPDC058084 TaxID=3346333 RepID=UPI0036E3CCE6
MTDDAYLFLVDDPATPLGASVTAVGDLACLETSAARAWPDVHGVTAASPRLLPPAERRHSGRAVRQIPVHDSSEGET